jgi:hypothetical protein
MLSSLKVKNIKEQEGERTSMAAGRSLLRMMTEGQNVQKWLQEHHQRALIADPEMATQAVMADDE